MECCDKPISEAEILTSIKKLPSSKTPGSDELPADFYQFFWCDIKNFINTKYYLCNGKRWISVEQKRGIITLLPKKGKNRLHLKFGDR